MPHKLHEFDGKRILVVEDEYLIADDLRRELTEHGATVVGPVASVNVNRPGFTGDRLV